MDQNTQFILEKLGAAIYLHKKLAEDAEKAAEAVEYLKEVGVLGTPKQD